MFFRVSIITLLVYSFLMREFSSTNDFTLFHKDIFTLYEIDLLLLLGDLYNLREYL